MAPEKQQTRLDALVCAYGLIHIAVRQARKGELPGPQIRHFVKPITPTILVGDNAWIGPRTEEAGELDGV